EMTLETSQETSIAQKHPPPPQTSRPRMQPSGTIWPWALPVFSLLPVSHAPVPKASPSLQITVTTGHVDNPADDVKFRRHHKTAAMMSRTKNRREKENKMAVAEKQSLPQTS